MSTVAPPTPPPAKPKAPPAVPKASPPVAARQIYTEPNRLQVRRGISASAHKVVIYGPGGVGKSCLAASMKEAGCEPLFIALEEGVNFLDVAQVNPVTWDEMRSVLQDREMLSQFGAVVIDSGTKAEELAVAWTVANIPHEKREIPINSIEDYGWGRGYMHVYETFLKLLGDLDTVARSGKHVVITAHDCTANVPNPEGADWIRYEPRLQSPPSGKGSIRHRVREWADHLLYIGFDVMVDREGKGKGGGTRTIYSSELPTFWAKSRKISEPIPYEKGSSELWRQLFA